MAKTLKQMLKGYEPKAEDEKKFKDKHTVKKTDDKNGNKDDIFSATNIKTIDRDATRHGYNPGSDEGVYEAAETPKKNQDVADKAFLKHKPGTVKGTLQQFGRFIANRPEIKEDMQHEDAVEELDEEVDTTLLALYAQLDEDNQSIMIRMIDEGRKAELLQFVEAIEE